MQEARRYSDASSKTALVDEALRFFLVAKHSEEQRRTYRQRPAQLQGELDGQHLRESSVDLLRRDRDFNAQLLTAEKRTHGWIAQLGARVVGVG